MEISNTYIITNLSSICLLILSLFGNSKKEIKISFIVLTAILILWINSVYFAHEFSKFSTETTITLIRIGDGLALLGSIAIFNFLNQFPNRKIDIPPKISVTLGAIAIATCIIIVGTKHVETPRITSGEITGAKFGIAYPLFIVQFLLYCTASAYVIIKMEKTSYSQKKQTRIMLSGLFALISLATLTNAILPLINIYILQKESILFSLLFLFPTFFSIHHYRLHNIDSKIINRFKQILALIILLSTTTILNSLIVTRFTNLSTTISTITSSSIGILVSIVFLKIFPDFEEHSVSFLNKTLHQIEANIYATKTYNKLFKELETGFILKLNLNQFNLYAIEGNYNNKKIATINLPVEHIEKLHKQKYLVGDKLKQLKKTQIISKETTLLLGLYFDRMLIGLLCLGEKENHQPWNINEINSIKEFTNMVATPFTNIIFRNVKNENIVLKKIIKQNIKKISLQYKNLQETYKQQRNFIMAVGHEFQTPITSALLNVEECSINVNKNRAIRQNLEIAKISLNQLKTLSNNFFSIQKYTIKSTLKEKTQLDAKILFDKFIKTTRKIYQDQKYAEKTIIIQNELKIDTQFECDESAINQLLNNLTHNALKFSENRTFIKIQQDKKSILIKIFNDGKSIPPSEKQKIFSIFYSYDAKSTGIGMGLYICQQIIKHHKGSIKILENEKNTKGTTFLISLPLKQMPDLAP